MKMVPLGSGLRTWSWWSRRRPRLPLFLFASSLCSSATTLAAHSVVVLWCLQYNYRNRGSLTFDPLTLVPIQVKLMKTELLTQKEVNLMMSSVSHDH